SISASPPSTVNYATPTVSPSLAERASPEAHNDAPPSTPPADNGAAAAKKPKKVHPEISPTILVVLEDFPRFAGLGDPKWGSWWPGLRRPSWHTQGSRSPLSWARRTPG